MVFKLIGEPEAEQGMKFPTCFTLSTLVLALWGAAAIPGSSSSFGAVFCALHDGGDAGVADAGEVDRPRGDGHEPGVLVPIEVGGDDGVGFF